MAEHDNFKHSKHQGVRRKTIDGFVRKTDANELVGSIGFDQKTDLASQAMGTSHMGDFSRPEGFHPGVQPLINTPPRIINKEAVSELPRQRGRHETEKLQKERRHKKPRSRAHKIVKRSILTILVLGLSLGGFLGWKFIYNTSKIFNGGGILGFLNSTKLQGEDRGRVNILLAGNSEDDPDHRGADLTDSIMLLSLDTLNNTGFMMSIPRDLWVTYGPKTCIAGSQGRINATYECGEQVKFKESGFPNGGMGLLEKVVEQNFGIDINYYTRINYTAFRDAVNAVGGIDFTVKADDPRGLYDGNIAKADGGPLKLSNGLHNLNGQTALNLARARCAQPSMCYGFKIGDFDRSEHQRQMLLALKGKALSAGVWSNPSKISSVLDALGNNVKTDFKTGEARRLYDIINKIDNANIKSIGLADEDVKLIQSANINGSSIQRPVAGLNDFSQIKAFIKKLTSNDPVVKEGANVVVLNASGKTGLAMRKADVLISKGLTVKTIANADKTRAATTVIMLNSQKSSTKSYLEQLYNTTPTTDLTANPEAKNYQADFVIIIGQNEPE